MGGKANFVKMLDSVFVMPPVFDDSCYGSVIHEIREKKIWKTGSAILISKKGGSFNVTMGAAPNKMRGVQESSYPYSFSSGADVDILKE